MYNMLNKQIQSMHTVKACTILLRAVGLYILPPPPPSILQANGYTVARALDLHYNAVIMLLKIKCNSIYQKVMEHLYTKIAFLFSPCYVALITSL